MIYLRVINPLITSIIFTKVRTLNITTVRLTFTTIACSMYILTMQYTNDNIYLTVLSIFCISYLRVEDGMRQY